MDSGIHVLIFALLICLLLINMSCIIFTGWNELLCISLIILGPAMDNM